jgi:hypothetical protein
MDRRLGRLVERYHVHTPIPILWDPQPRRWWRRTPDPVTAHIVEISVMGALIDCDQPTAAQIGDTVEFSRDEKTGLVKVKRKEPRPGGEVLGVQFVDVSRALRDLDDIIVQAGRKAPNLVEIWER